MCRHFLPKITTDLVQTIMLDEIPIESDFEISYLDPKSPCVNESYSPKSKIPINYALENWRELIAAFQSKTEFLIKDWSYIGPLSVTIIVH